MGGEAEVQGSMQSKNFCLHNYEGLILLYSIHEWERHTVVDLLWKFYKHISCDISSLSSLSNLTLYGPGAA